MHERCPVEIFVNLTAGWDVGAYWVGDFFFQRQICVRCQSHNVASRPLWAPFTGQDINFRSVNLLEVLWNESIVVICPRKLIGLLDILRIITGSRGLHVEFKNYLINFKSIGVSGGWVCGVGGNPQHHRPIQPNPQLIVMSLIIMFTITKICIFKLMITKFNVISLSTVLIMDNCNHVKFEFDCIN